MSPWFLPDIYLILIFLKWKSAKQYSALTEWSTWISWDCKAIIPAFSIPASGGSVPTNILSQMNPAVLQIKGKYCISTDQVSNKLKKKVLRFFFWQSVFNTRKVFSHLMEQNSNTELFNQYMVCKGNLLSVSTPFVLTLKNTARGKKLYICSYLENLVSKVSDHRSRDFQHFLRDS